MLRETKWWHWALFAAALICVLLGVIRGTRPEGADYPPVPAGVGQPKGAPRTPEEIAEIEGSKQMFEEMKRKKQP